MPSVRGNNSWKTIIDFLGTFPKFRRCCLPKKNIPMIASKKTCNIVTLNPRWTSYLVHVRWWWRAWRCFVSGANPSWRGITGISPLLETWRAWSGSLVVNRIGQRGRNLKGKRGFALEMRTAKHFKMNFLRLQTSHWTLHLVTKRKVQCEVCIEIWSTVNHD